MSKKNVTENNPVSDETTQKASQSDTVEKTPETASTPSGRAESPSAATETEADNSSKSNEDSVTATLHESIVTGLEAALAAKETELKEQTDKTLRLYAEMENFKRRKEQELDSFRKYAAEKFLHELLPILDSLELASHHVETESPETKKVVEGFLLIRKQFHHFLEKMGVFAIDAVDKAFDPNLHQSVSQEKVEGKEPGIVIREMQKGYKLHDRVLRPSLVVVSM